MKFFHTPVHFFHTSPLKLTTQKHLVSKDIKTKNDLPMKTFHSCLLMWRHFRGQKLFSQWMSMPTEKELKFYFSNFSIDVVVFFLSRESYTLSSSSTTLAKSGGYVFLTEVYIMYIIGHSKLTSWFVCSFVLCGFWCPSKDVICAAASLLRVKERVEESKRKAWEQRHGVKTVQPIPQVM